MKSQKHCIAAELTEKECTLSLPNLARKDHPALIRAADQPDDDLSPALLLAQAGDLPGDVLLTP